MFIIQKGSVELFNKRTKQLYEKLEDGDYFAMESLFFKTARNWSSSIARGYTDLTILPIDAFYVIVNDFPKEGDRMRQLAIQRIDEMKIFANSDIFRMVNLHSSKSVGPNFELEYTPDNIILQTLWIGSAYKKLSKAMGVNIRRRSDTGLGTIDEENSDSEESF